MFWNVCVGFADASQDQTVLLLFSIWQINETMIVLVLGKSHLEYKRCLMRLVWLVQTIKEMQFCLCLKRTTTSLTTSTFARPSLRHTTRPGSKWGGKDNITQVVVVNYKTFVFHSRQKRDERKPLILSFHSVPLRHFDFSQWPNKNVTCVPFHAGFFLGKRPAQLPKQESYWEYHTHAHLRIWDACM